MCFVLEWIRVLGCPLSRKPAIVVDVEPVNRIAVLLNNAFDELHQFPLRVILRLHAKPVDEGFHAFGIDVSRARDPLIGRRQARRVSGFIDRDHDDVDRCAELVPSERMEMPKFIGSVVMKKEAASGSWIVDSGFTGVMLVRIEDAGLPHQGGFTGVKRRPCRHGYARNGSRHQRFHTELASIHVGVSLNSAVVYPV